MTSLILQLLESIYIIETSTRIDTMKGRKEFIDERATLIRSESNPDRYPSDFQEALDRYKELYYDRIPSQTQLAIGLSLDQGRINTTYLVHLQRAMLEHFKIQMEQVAVLKTEKGKEKRRAKLEEETQQFLQEFTLYNDPERKAAAEKLIYVIPQIQ